MIEAVSYFANGNCRWSLTEEDFEDYILFWNDNEDRAHGSERENGLGIRRQFSKPYYLPSNWELVT